KAAATEMIKPLRITASILPVEGESQLRAEFSPSFLAPTRNPEGAGVLCSFGVCQGDVKLSTVVLDRLAGGHIE
ncbi:MAG: hypothetical protein OXF42_04500, partial [Candidatus Dadabacteria bacterium]|nr:hypothetical protein [Candidatus Dadabacteria bacterium]